jgi:DNA-binding PadR family transcriptional regulator
MTDLPLTPLTMAILLSLAGEDMHGYTLMREIHRQTDGTLSPGTGSLYAALQRLMEDGLIVESPELPAPDEDQRRKYFRITEAGRDVAAAEAGRMMRVLDIARGKAIVPDLRVARGDA